MTDTPNTPEPKPVSMRDLRESLAMIARPAGVPVSFGGLSVALDELERLRALDAPALSEALKVAAEDLAREREGAGLLRMALQDLGAGDRHAARAALYSDAGKAALEERRALEAKVGKAKEAAFSEVESEMESLGFSAEEGWADVLRTLKAEVERLTRERDEAKERAAEFKRLVQEFERDVRATFEQSCKNLKRAKVAEAEVKRLRAALLNYLQAGHKEARERAAQQAKVALGIPPEHSGREPQYALAPSQPAPANPNIDPDTGLDHTPEPIRPPAPVVHFVARPKDDDAESRCGSSWESATNDWDVVTCAKCIKSDRAPSQAGEEQPRLPPQVPRHAFDAAREPFCRVCGRFESHPNHVNLLVPSPAGEGEGQKTCIHGGPLEKCADPAANEPQPPESCESCDEPPGLLFIEDCEPKCVTCALRDGDLAGRADIAAAVAKAVAEAWERAAQIVEGPMVPGSRVPTTEERGLAAIFRNRARSTSPAGGAP